MLCRKLAKQLDKLARTLDDLHKSIEPKGLNSKKDQEAHNVQVIQTQEVLEEARSTHNQAEAKMYEIRRNLMFGDLQTQRDMIGHKMHKHDLWAGVNGQMTVGRLLYLWIAFQDCLKLHKLTVFTADMVNRQQYYLQQAVRKPQRAAVHQHISHIGVLNDYVKYLPTLKDSPTKAASEVQNKMILMGHQMLYCHAPVVRSFFIYCASAYFSHGSVE